MAGARGLTAALAAIASSIAFSGARAEIRVLQVADPNGAGVGAYELQAKEASAVVLNTAAQDYPLHVRSVTVRVGAPLLGGTRGHTGDGTLRIHVWQDVGTADPGAHLYESPNPVSASSGDNTFDLRAEGIVVASGNFRVGFEVVQEGADVYIDENGRTANRNYLLGKQAGTADTFHWQVPPGSFLIGDFIISAEVETRYGDGGVIAPDGGIADAGASGGDGGVAPPDAGAVADAGVSATDAGPGADAGNTTDAGASADAGVVPHDAGASSGSDGGLTGPARSGCKCDASGDGGLAAIVWLGLAALVLRARRRSFRG